MAMFESLMNLCGQLPPEVSVQLLDMVVELSDVPGKEEMVRRIRKINGQTDPDETDSPEARAQAEAAREQADLQSRAVQVQLAEAEAKVRKLLAETQLLLEKAKSEQTDRSLSVAEQSTAHVMARAQLADQAYRRTLDTFKARNDLADSAHKRNLDTTQARAGLQDQFHRQGMEVAKHRLNAEDQGTPSRDGKDPNRGESTRSQRTPKDRSVQGDASPGQGRGSGRETGREETGEEEINL